MPLLDYLAIILCTGTEALVHTSEGAMFVRVWLEV